MTYDHTPYRIGYHVVSNSGTLNHGNIGVIAPATSSKSVNGAGSNVTGDGAASYSGVSILIQLHPKTAAATS